MSSVQEAQRRAEEVSGVTQRCGCSVLVRLWLARPEILALNQHTTRI